MFELLRIFVALIGSSIAGLYDLKTTNIPDSVAVAMILIGFSFHVYEGFIANSFSGLIDALLFGSILFVFSFLMYRTGQWGGGDGELLVGITVLLPTSSLIQTLFPFSISFLINTFFVGSVYSVVFLVFYILNDKELKKNFWRNFLITMRKGIYKRIPTQKLKVDDMLGEDIPKLKLYKKVLKGLKIDEVRKIQKLKKYVIIKEGIRYGPVFFLTLIITLIFGDVILIFV